MPWRYIGLDIVVYEHEGETVHASPEIDGRESTVVDDPPEWVKTLPEWVEVGAL